MQGDAIDLVRPFSEEIVERAAEFEAQGFVSQDLVDRLVETGVYRLCNSHDVGGLDGSPLDYARVTEYLAARDGSTAWVVFIGITAALSFTSLPPESLKDVFADRQAAAAGVFAPMGRAVPAVQNGEEGYILNGRWPWGSGSRNSKLISGGGFVVTEEGSIEKLSNGAPHQLSFFMKTEDVELLDTWHVTGMKGTGSTDFQVENLFVPKRMTANILAPHPSDAPIHKFPVFGFLGIGISAVSLGLARAAIDALVELATVKTPQGSTKPLAARSSTHIKVATAEAQLRAARSLFYEEIEKCWTLATSGQKVDLEARRDLRLALTHAAQVCAEVVKDMYTLAGGSSVYASSPIQRYFRDAHVATQHMMVAEGTLELAGRSFLGLEVNESQL